MGYRFWAVIYGLYIWFQAIFTLRLAGDYVLPPDRPVYLTLVFGVMDFINLAHGVQYMLGAYLAVTFTALTGNLFLALPLALVAAMILGLLLEVAVFRHLYDRDHL